jgi:hypothetical protein
MSADFLYDRRRRCFPHHTVSRRQCQVPISRMVLAWTVNIDAISPGVPISKPHHHQSLTPKGVGYIDECLRRQRADPRAAIVEVMLVQVRDSLSYSVCLVHKKAIDESQARDLFDGVSSFRFCASTFFFDSGRQKPLPCLARPLPAHACISLVSKVALAWPL